MPPNSKRTFRRASPSLIPALLSSEILSSMWNWSSRPRSCSNLLRRHHRDHHIIGHPPRPSSESRPPLQLTVASLQPAHSNEPALCGSSGRTSHHAHCPSLSI